LKSFLLTPEFKPVTVLAGIAILVVCLLCFYLVTHLRFAFFHCLIHQTREIRPAWALYRIQAERSFTASLLVWLAFPGMVILAVAVSPGGPLAVFIRSSSLSFYGGHYRALGNLLYPPPPPVVVEGTPHTPQPWPLFAAGLLSPSFHPFGGHGNRAFGGWPEPRTGISQPEASARFTQGGLPMLWG